MTGRVAGLHLGQTINYISAMKFFWAIVVYLLIGIVLSWGILLALKGNFWVVGVAFFAYVVAFSKIGCLPKAH